MTNQRCTLTELYIDQCAHCRPAADPVAQFLEGPAVTMGPWFEAHYDGECDSCGAAFEAGDQIRADGEGGWVADCCGREAT